MIIYVNGDSHGVGCGIKSNSGMTTDSDDYLDIDEAPHPANLPYTYGAVLANKLNANLVCQARSGGSIARCIRTTKQFVYQTKGELLVVIGWPSFEREEWFHNGTWWPINGSGYETLPPTLEVRYKEWVSTLDESYSFYERQKVIYPLIVEFHEWLLRHKVKHLFFNTAQSFQIPSTCDFGNYYVNPYDTWYGNSPYLRWAEAQGFKPVDEWGHYGEDAHQAWAEFLLPYAEKVLNQ